MRKNNFMNKIIKLKGSILAGVLNINECKIKIWKQASNCSLEDGRKDEEVQISTEYNEIQILLHYILHNYMFNGFIRSYICQRKL